MKFNKILFILLFPVLGLVYCSNQEKSTKAAPEDPKPRLEQLIGEMIIVGVDETTLSQNPSVKKYLEKDELEQLKHLEVYLPQQLSKEEVLNSDELASVNRKAGQNTSFNNQQIETIVREVKKIGRNEKVTIKNISNGNQKTLKYKVAENLLKGGDWIIMND